MDKQVVFKKEGSSFKGTHTIFAVTPWISQHIYGRKLEKRISHISQKRYGVVLIRGRFYEVFQPKWHGVLDDWYVNREIRISEEEKELAAYIDRRPYWKMAID